MSIDSSVPLLTAVRDALLASVPLQAVIGNPPRVYDKLGVPPDVWPGGGVNFPSYVTTGPVRLVDDVAKAKDGATGDLNIESWSSQPSQLDLLTIMAAINGAINRQPLVLVGHNLILIYLDNQIPDFDASEASQIGHGPQRFRFFTEDAT